MNKTPPNNQSAAQSTVLILKGFCMGVADIIPGISGGTIAFIVGIYEELIFAIRSFNLQFVKRLASLKFKEAFAGVAWQFLGCVLAGIITAILIFSHIISYLIENNPVFVNAFFFGLILATIPIIAMIIKRWTYAEILAVLIAGIGTFFLVAMAPVETPDAYWFLFLCGFVAISAMILPGISGAFILVLLGKYTFVINAIKTHDLVNIAVIGSGIIIGVISFVRILGWLLHRYHDMTVAVLTGFVIGSLNKIWPWKEVIEVIYDRHGKIIPVKEVNVVPASFDMELLIAIGLMAAGFIIALLLNTSHKRETLNV